MPEPPRPNRDLIPHRLLTSREVGNLFGVGTKAVRRWTAAGRLAPVTRTPGGHMRFDADEVAALRAAGTTARRP